MASGPASYAGRNYLANVLVPPARPQGVHVLEARPPDPLPDSDN